MKEENKKENCRISCLMLISLPESLRLPVWKYVCIFCVYEEDEEEDRKWCIKLGTINNSPTAAWRNWELHSPHTVTRNYTFLYFSLSSPFQRNYSILYSRYQRYLQNLKIVLISEQTDWWVR